MARSYRTVSSRTGRTSKTSQTSKTSKTSRTNQTNKTNQTNHQLRMAGDAAGGETLLNFPDVRLLFQKKGGQPRIKL